MTTDEAPKRKRGRPKKTEMVSRKRGATGLSRGRPKGDAAIINEYKGRMLSSPKSKLVLESIFNAALNDEHKHQAAAWKLVVDRIMPLSYFEKDKVAGGKSAINISITGVGGEQTTISSGSTTDDIDGEAQYIE
jgi:hypothetical protein|tara:strand:+ start:281 stop:682 length:402 start_codon:yes stop_codon:yes gene_type:complete